MSSNRDSGNEKELFIGRENEITQLINVMNDNDRNITLITGDLGIGKSALLNEFYSRIIGEEKFLVGYYREVLVAKSKSLDFPFRIVLSSLANEAKKLESLNERRDNTLARVMTFVPICLAALSSSSWRRPVPPIR